MFDSSHNSANYNKNFVENRGGTITMAPKKNLPRKAGEFKVERIVADKFVGDKRFFFIKWKDYTASENTWEPEENLRNCTSLMRDYFNGKGLRNSKSHTLSTTLLRSLGVSKQRRSSISSLISISSPKSSRKLVVNIKPVDMNVFQRKDRQNANRQPGKSVASSVLDKYSPRVQLVRIDLPEILPKISSETSIDSEKMEYDMKEKSILNESNMNEHSTENTQLTDCSSISLKLSDESQNDNLSEHSEVNNRSSENYELIVKLPKVYSWTSTDSKPAEALPHSPETVSSQSGIDESPATTSDDDTTKQNLVPANSNMDSIKRRSKSLEPRLVVLSAPPVLNGHLDEIEDSDEDLLMMKVFEEDFKNDEKSNKRGPSKKRKRRKYL